jgi:hypothetical protein
MPDIEFLREQAEAAKKHLEKHVFAIVDVYCDVEDLEMNKTIFAEVLGEKIIKRVLFLPQYK